MARTKGSLNKRTLAALDAVEHGKFDGTGDKLCGYLLKIAADESQSESTRMQAAKIVLPYLKPALSAMEQTIVEPATLRSEAELSTDLKESLRRAMLENPDLVQQILGEQARSAQPVAVEIQEAVQQTGTDSQ